MAVVERNDTSSVPLLYLRVFGESKTQCPEDTSAFRALIFAFWSVLVFMATTIFAIIIILL